ncbi:type II toxin-antitoxin system ParD family antitoxin [Ruegeria sp. HKCCD8929]|uniref:type II toxin-antitoxin system ParD family antitoxin n=1 Tax=Ruegeria sp. HKCCD8929 TaxID=2683006 RepID=UPI001488C66C|nr:type II toxin-antitoxin system ParD family antitoxin [Ruegeria sp. HKCCD8929]
MTVKTSISLSEAQAEYARELVERGMFPSLSAVAQHGIDLIRQRQEAEWADSEALKLLLRERARGPFLPEDQFRARVSQMLERKRAADGLED